MNEVKERMSVVDRFFARLDEFKWGQAKRRVAFQPQQNRVISFRNSANSQAKRAIPTFGSDVGFGEEYCADAPSRPFTGPQPIEHENVHGYVNPNAERPVPEQEPYQDPSLSSRGSRTSESTDQKPPIGHGITPADKPITLYTGSRKTFQGARGKSGETEADKAEKDLKAYSYDFSN
jgi:hypothetical protein